MIMLIGNDDDDDAEASSSINSGEGNDSDLHHQDGWALAKGVFHH